MSMEADQIVDRRRLRRKVTVWRVVAFVVAVVAILAIFGVSQGRDAIPGWASPQIARLTVNGFIAENRPQIELIDKLAKAGSVKAVIVSIDSTGGSTAGGEALYEAVRKLAAAKPTVATIGTFGASAAYMTAIATDHIVARRSSITGSIGVIFQFPEVSKLMDTLGVRIEELKSGPLKAEPSPFRPASDAAKAVVQGLINDTYDWFVSIVAERRGLAPTDARVLADGRIFSGRQALAANLIDEIGGEDEAIAWLADKKAVDRKLPVNDWSPAKPGGFFSLSNAAIFWLGEKLGISPALLGGGILDRLLPRSLKLDGLLSVWQGPVAGGEDPTRGADE
ncbi:MAG: signal peptide peptidase SppA [Bauldia sp.]